ILGAIALLTEGGLLRQAEQGRSQRVPACSKVVRISRLFVAEVVLVLGRQVITSLPNVLQAKLKVVITPQPAQSFREMVLAVYVRSRCVDERRLVRLRQQKTHWPE